MAERTTKRPAGATRLPNVKDPSVPDPSVLTSIDASLFSHDQLVRALEDRGLSIEGDDDALRARLTDDITGA